MPHSLTVSHDSLMETEFQLLSYMNTVVSLHHTPSVFVCLFLLLLLSHILSLLEPFIHGGSFSPPKGLTYDSILEASHLASQCISWGREYLQHQSSVRDTKGFPKCLLSEKKICWIEELRVPWKFLNLFHFQEKTHPWQSPTWYLSLKFYHFKSVM